MAVTHYDLTATFLDPEWAPFTASDGSIVAWIETNVGNTEGIVDTVANAIALGGLRKTASSTGAVSWTNLVGSDSTPADIGIASGTLQYRVTAEYKNPVTRRRDRWVSGWFSLTSDVDLADVIAEQYLPAEWITQATAAVQAIVDDATSDIASLVGLAQAAQAGAEAARDAAVDLSNIDTPDALVAALIAGTAGAGPLTRAELSASTADSIQSGETDPQAAVDARATARATEQVTTRTQHAPRLSDGIFGAIDATLSAGRNAAIQIQGDSTGNATDEWVYLLTQWLAARHPSAHVKYKLWDDASQGYAGWTTIQAGASGERHALFKGINVTRTMTQKVANIPAVTGDIDIRVRANLVDWTPSATQDLVAHYGGAGNRGWRVGISSAGGIDFVWTTDGTTNIQKVTSNASITDGTEAWIRVTLDVDNGAGGYTFTAYKSTDGVTWTTVGTSVDTTSGATSIFAAPAQEYEIGGRGLTGNPLNGKIYEVQIRDGIGGKIVNPQPIDSWMPRDATGSYETGSFGGSPTLYVLNGSHPGAATSYLADTTRHPKMVQPYAGSLNFQSCSYNDYDAIDGAYLTDRTAWLALTDARAPGSQTVLVTQGPMASPIETNRIGAHLRRRQLLMAWAARKGLAVVDTYQRFLDHPGGYASLIQSDGIHPTAANGSGDTGEEIWLAAVTDAWEAASPTA